METYFKAVIRDSGWNNVIYEFIFELTVILINILIFLWVANVCNKCIVLYTLLNYFIIYTSLSFRILQFNVHISLVTNSMYKRSNTLMYGCIFRGLNLYSMKISRKFKQNVHVINVVSSSKYINFAYKMIFYFIMDRDLNIVSTQVWSRAVHV